MVPTISIRFLLGPWGLRESKIIFLDKPLQLKISRQIVYKEMGLWEYERHRGLICNETQYYKVLELYEIDIDMALSTSNQLFY